MLQIGKVTCQIYCPLSGLMQYNLSSYLEPVRHGGTRCWRPANKQPPHLNPCDSFSDAHTYGPHWLGEQTEESNPSTTRLPSTFLHQPMDQWNGRLADGEHAVISQCHHFIQHWGGIVTCTHIFDKGIMLYIIQNHLERKNKRIKYRN